MRNIRLVFGMLMCLLYFGQMIPTVSAESVYQKPMAEFFARMYQGDFEKAEAELNRFRSEGVNPILADLGEVYLDLEKGQLDEAEKTLSETGNKIFSGKSVDKLSEDERYLLSLMYRATGFIYLFKGDSFNAHAFFYKANVTYPDEISLTNIAILARKEGGLMTSEELVTSQEKIAEHSPYPQNKIHLAILYDKMGKNKEAEALVQEAWETSKKTGIESYFALDMAAFDSIAGGIAKAREMIRVYWARYKQYPSRQKLILQTIQTDPDFQNLRNSEDYLKFVDPLRKSIPENGSR